MFFLEVALGQFTSEGGITCWEKLCPIFTGRAKTGGLGNLIIDAPSWLKNSRLLLSYSGFPPHKDGL